MQQKHRIWISLLAAIGSLALVFSLWTKNPVRTAFLEADASHTQHAFCAGTANSFYFAEVKSRLNGFISGGTMIASGLITLSPEPATSSPRVQEEPTAGSSPPLWLLHRALLI